PLTAYRPASCFFVLAHPSACSRYFPEIIPNFFFIIAIMERHPYRKECCYAGSHSLFHRIGRSRSSRPSNASPFAGHRDLVGERRLIGHRSGNAAHCAPARRVAVIADRRLASAMFRAFCPVQLASSGRGGARRWLRGSFPAATEKSTLYQLAFHGTGAAV